MMAGVRVRGSVAARVIAPVRAGSAGLLVALVRAYQLTAVIRSPRCRFYPSCSSYAIGALRVHGAGRGLWLAVRRLGRCHPWNPGGVDHVPPRSEML